MFALIITLSLVSGGFASILCPKAFNPNETIHLAHPTSCSKFLTCVGTFPVEQDCPAGLHWNVEHSRCDYPGFPRCTRDNEQEPKSFNVKAVSTSVCLPQSYQCPLNSKPEEHVVFLKHRDCRKFYACVSTHPVELSCPPKLYWNSRSCVCDYEKEEECDEMMARVEEDAPEEADEVEQEPSQQGEADEAEQPAENEDAPEAADEQENPAQEQEDIPEEAYEAEPEGSDNAEESMVARKRRAADGSSSSNNDSSGGSGSSGSESSGSGSSGSGSSGSGSSGSGSSGSGSSGSGSNGSGSSESGSGGSPTQSGADIRTVSSIVVVVATVFMCAL